MCVGLSNGEKGCDARRVSAVLKRRSRFGGRKRSPPADRGRKPDAPDINFLTLIPFQNPHGVYKPGLTGRPGEPEYGCFCTDSCPLITQSSRSMEFQTRATVLHHHQLYCRLSKATCAGVCVRVYVRVCVRARACVETAYLVSMADEIRRHVGNNRPFHGKMMFNIGSEYHSKYSILM